MVRQGLDVVASLRAASRGWERPYELDECVRRWNRDVGFSVERLAASDDLAVLYEELVASPGPVIVPAL